MTESLTDQVWVGSEEPTPEKLNPVQTDQVDRSTQKPKGGFWTSPLRDGSSPWIEWLQSKGWCPHSDPNAWLLTVDGDPAVYDIVDIDDLKAITIEPDEPEYGPTGIINYRIDWETVFTDYDAVYLTQEGLENTRITGRTEPDLYGWDCETILWDGWYFGDVTLLGEVNVTT